MNSNEALETLRRSEQALRARGVRRAALFGSVVRGENGPGSDIDIMVEIDPDAHITVFEYVGLKEYIGDLFDGPGGRGEPRRPEAPCSSCRDGQRDLCLLDPKSAGSAIFFTISSSPQNCCRS